MYKFFFFSAISCRVKIVNHFRITYLTIADADEQFAMNYEEFASTCDDSGFLETPKTPATLHSVDYFVNHYIYLNLDLYIRFGMLAK